jgi:glycosyltransferase involved in cell wall biosynthesis
VIASDLGSRRELIDPGVTGLLFPTGNVEHLAKAIAFLHEHPEVASRMGAAGRERVRQRHSVADHYRLLTGLYERVIESKRKSTKPSGAAKGLKIAFIGGRGVHSRYSGIEAYYEEVGSRLAEAGHSVTVYCRTYFTPAMSDYRGMRVVRLPSIRSKHLETVVHTLLSTLHATFSRYDIVHYHALGPSLFSWIPRLAGKKTVVTVQGLDWQRRKWGILAAMVLRLGESASARLPDATMVVSRTLEQRYRRRHGVSAFYVPNGTRLFARGSDRALEKWGLVRDQYALFLGRFSPEKNCHLLVEAFEKAKTPMKLVLAGGSSHTDAYAHELRSHASERIVFLNYVSGSELEDLLVNAALFVLPSDLEGLSLALLDAMGAGVCALTSDIPENQELVDGVGFTFQRGNVDDLARMLQLLLNDSAIRAAAGSRGQQRIREQYLWSEITPRIEEVYFSVLGINREKKKEAAKEELPLEKEDFRVA